VWKCNESIRVEGGRRGREERRTLKGEGVKKNE